MEYNNLLLDYINKILKLLEEVQTEDDAKIIYQFLVGLIG